MTTKVLLKEEIWHYHYDKIWTDSTILPIRMEYPNLIPLRHFSEELVAILESYGINTFLRERETMPDLNGLIVRDSIFFENEKDALAFILKI
jgi:hypothetical protein